MRIVTWNVNGIRAAIRKGLDEFVERIAPDILLQGLEAGNGRNSLESG